MDNIDHIKAEREVLSDVFDETERQIKKWGYQEHIFEAWKAILEEEFAEMKTEVIVCKKDGYEEGVQVAAVMLSWLRDLKARRNNVRL